ncbi:hypothetical protein AVEN_225395-1 [Araneus ventricosus]|uniref:Uncharacterized protein n=1 Tax=Araneus ventricosus TaxID=182803 RepID=A0A4Y2HX83_ARAVE|nr:hypothetical protein AVEN_225395-1 [Araneus ventricosus]
MKSIPVESIAISGYDVGDCQRSWTKDARARVLYRDRFGKPLQKEFQKKSMVSDGWDLDAFALSVCSILFSVHLKRFIIFCHTTTYILFRKRNCYLSFQAHSGQNAKR